MSLAPPAEIVPGRFLSGFVAPLRAVRYVLGHPSLIPFASLPLMANMVVLFALVFVLGPHAAHWVDSVLPREGWKHVLFSIPLQIVAWGLALAIGAVFVNLFGTLIASPFNDILSGRVESLEGRLPADRILSWGQAVARIGLVLIDELKKWTVYLAVMAALLPLVLIPVAGHLAFTLLGSLVTFWFLGFEYLDYCFTRRHMHFAERRTFCWRNKTAIIGLGAAVTTATMIPFANFVVMPLAVVGATLLFLDLVPAGAERQGP